MEQSLHCLIHPAALLLAMDLLVVLDRLLKAFRRTIHNLLLLLDHVHLPIELVEHNMEEVETRAYSRVCGLGPNWTGAPAGDCNPDDVGLFGVSSS